MPEMDWKFTEEQRPAVCRGELCPKCLGTDTKQVGSVPDYISFNYVHECGTCGERWEGY